MILKGAFTAAITPFTAQNQLDEEGFRQNLRFQLQNGMDGIIVLGTTGEAPTTDAEEKKRIIKIAVEEVKGKAHLLVGTGSYSTKQTIANTLQAQELGADAAIVIAPFYNKPTQEGLFQHFKTICHSTTLPICIYNHHGRCGVNMHVDILKRLADYPSIIGIKDSSTIQQISDVVENIVSQRPDFGVLTGDDPLTLPTLAFGGHGVISTVSNLVPAQIRNLVYAGLKGDFIEARRWHYQLAPLYHASFIETNPIPIKAAMNLCGMAAGHCRLPLCDLLPENFRKLQKVIQSLPQEWFRSQIVERESEFAIAQSHT